MIDNLILKIRSGSHLYGTNTETSDEDYVGVFIPETKYLIGLHNVEQIDESEKVKLESGKNAPESKDVTYYTLAKFCKLALDNNPNILELLFVNQENIIRINPLKYEDHNHIGEELLSLRKYFVSKLLKSRFLGYAFSQKHKMVIKLENFEKITEATEYLRTIEEHSNLKFLNDILNHPLFVRKKDIITVGDVNLQATVTIIKAIQMLGMRQQKFGARKELVEKYGFDTKFASHLIRLILEGIELLETGNLIFPLQFKDTLMGIRLGALSLTQIIELSDALEKQVEKLYETSKLPHSPNFKVVEDFVIRTHKQFI